jgi:hypothetical protein
MVWLLVVMGLVVVTAVVLMVGSFAELASGESAYDRTDRLIRERVRATGARVQPTTASSPPTHASAA